jgi:predicted RNA methylase
MHWNMINDYVRNNAYEAAINEVVNSESVVIDLGTGTGLLALMAARAGAKRVYAIERNPITAGESPKRNKTPAV